LIGVSGENRKRLKQRLQLAEVGRQILCLAASLDYDVFACDLPTTCM
jgi:hypothetical protein